jgi:hypothetical protein
VTEPQPDVVQIDPQRQLRRIAEHLASLGKLPAFEYLIAETARKGERMKAALVAQMMNGMDFSPLQRQADYDRGFIEGMKYIEAVVTGAQNTLAKLDQGEEPDEPDVDRWSHDNTPE